MKNKLRILSGILAVLLICLSSAACMSDGNGESTDTQAESATEPISEKQETAADDATESQKEAITEGETEPETIPIVIPAEEPADITEGGTLYMPSSAVFALSVGKAYAFADLAMSRMQLPTFTEGQSLYADAVALTKLLGFDTSAFDGQTLTAETATVTVTFAVGANEIRVGDAQYAFPTVVSKNGTAFICADYLAAMLGYRTVSDNGLWLFCQDETKLTQERTTSMKERFDLYDSTVFNHEDVECDQTGVDRYTSVDPSERLVGIAYTTWHWKNRGWGEGVTWDIPLLGEYESLDADVVRQHGIWLRDAGVDFVFVDWSNNTCYDPETMAASRIDFRTIEEGTDLLFEVWSQIEGAPKICFLMGPGHSGQANVDNGNHQRKVDQVYRDYVEKYPDMFFCYEGKPLIICYGATPTQYGVNPTWKDSRFTVRWMTGFVGQQGSLYNVRTMASQTYWSWEERGTQTYCIKKREVEAVTCSAATRAQGSDESDPSWIPPAGRQNGATLKRQFQRAIDLGARFALVVSWNEWVLGEQLSAEISKDIEPSQLYGTFYLDLLTELIAKFKGKV